MSLVEHYRTLYEYEKDCNHKMLAMLESVSEAGRTDPRFPQAISIAGHLASCREFWLGHMEGIRGEQIGEEDKPNDPAALPSRFTALEQRWADYLARLNDSNLAQDFEFTEASGENFRVPIGIQIEQLAGHAAYHRGQIALLVTQLGGDTAGTDYADWWWENHSD